MKNLYKTVGTIIFIFLIGLIFLFIGGYYKWLVGYIFLWIIQGYTAWFLYIKCNQPFVGYSVTMGIGAYGTIILSVVYNWPIIIAIILSVFLSMIVAILFFLSTSRAKGFYVTMVSFLMAILFPKIIDATREISGGRSGLYFKGFDISENVFFILILLITILILVFYSWFMKTKIGQILTLISENDNLTKAIGINTFRYKILAYGIAGFISAIGGALYVNYIGFVSSIDLNVFTTVYIAFMPIVGGSKVFYGPLLGVLFIKLTPDIVRPLERYMDIFLGISFLSIMLFLPNGLGPTFEKLFKKAKYTIVRK